MIEQYIDNGFAIAVCVYLLYERTRFNIKISDSLKEIAVVMKELCGKK